jgi:hypothetical protein
MFIATVFYYLVNDTVPTEYLGRFISAFRVVGTAGMFTFNKWVLPMAETHFREIFVGAACLYLFAFLLICWRVREGPYPPPPPVDRSKGIVWGAIKDYIRTCFSDRLFLFFFATNACFYASQTVVAFNTLFAQSIGVDLRSVGNVNAWLTLVSMILMYPFGMLTDRVGPLRLLALVYLLLLSLAVFGFVGVRDYSSWLILSIFMFPLLQIRPMLEMTFQMRLLPRARYGQFASANGMVISAVAASSALGAGWFMDRMKDLSVDKSRYYHWMFMWTAAFLLGAMVCLILLWRELRHRNSVASDAS